MKERLLGKDPDELRAVAEEAGLPRFAASQIAQWLYVKKVRSIEEMTNLSKAGRAALSEKYEVGCTGYDMVHRSVDGTRKYLFPVGGQAGGSDRTLERSAVEAVMIPDGDRATLCVSSQSGCRMGCRFCMTGRQGFHGNLHVADIISQFIAIDESDSLTNAVFIGMGEPLDNFDNTVRFLKLVSDSGGINIGLRHISLSTSGVVSGIKKLAEYNFPITLSVSLHAPFDEIRSKMMPVNRKWHISELLAACREYQKVTTRRISFEYALIDGVNDSDICAEQLSKILKGIMCHVNLIPANPVKENSFKKPDRNKILYFKEQLIKRGVNATVRRTLGADIDASCGQLRKRIKEGGDSENIQ